MFIQGNYEQQGILGIQSNHLLQTKESKKTFQFIEINNETVTKEKICFTNLVFIKQKLGS